MVVINQNLLKESLNLAVNMRDKRVPCSGTVHSGGIGVSGTNTFLSLCLVMLCNHKLL